MNRSRTCSCEMMLAPASPNLVVHAGWVSVVLGAFPLAQFLVSSKFMVPPFQRKVRPEPTAPVAAMQTMRAIVWRRTAIEIVFDCDQQAWPINKSPDILRMPRYLSRFLWLLIPSCEIGIVYFM